MNLIPLIILERVDVSWESIHIYIDEPLSKFYVHASAGVNNLEVLPSSLKVVQDDIDAPLAKMPLQPTLLPEVLVYPETARLITVGHDGNPNHGAGLAGMGDPYPGNPIYAGIRQFTKCR
jgi:hypothetical protein